jgi:predicted ATPase/signal transduction histidine kinase
MANFNLKLPNYEISQEIYASTRSVVYRGVREPDGKPVIVKVLRNEFPRFNELVQFRNQYAIAKHLNFPNLLQTYSLENCGNGYALILEDFGGISLSDYLVFLERQGSNPRGSGLPLDEFFAIAVQVADALNELYHQHIIHKDLKPANILINPETKQVKIIDFSIASRLPSEIQTIQNPNVLEGTLAYLSPEQTGRMNRGIDYRTDFYSLGVTFYELLARQVPFVIQDSMELIHAHLAQEPTPLNRINPQIPPIVCAIVAKLMAKNAENRYQSALGLKYDLEECARQWQTSGAISEFELGQRDLRDRFIIRETLYGRQDEVKTLLDAFERVASAPQDSASTRGTEIMLVAGFSGIGKTAIVNEVHKPIVRQRGYFIKGKFDQFERNLPFSAFVSAFRDLMGQVLSETDAQIEQWKVKILNALGNNASVIVDVIPELAEIVGEQQRAPELSGMAAENRFNLLFQKFIRLFSTADHPLVIFLDDLQWVDLASLKLIELLASDRDCPYLFTIGAYRDNEVSPTHPLMQSLADIEKNGAKLHKITLSSLASVDVNHWICDTLNCSSKLAEPLTKLVFQKTKGNPFFITQFLKALYEEGAISFDFQLRSWQCDLSRVKDFALTDDAIEFMGIQLQKLPQNTQTVLKLAACIGHQFDLNTLAIVREQSAAETAGDLWKALEEGLVLPTSQVYKFFQAEDIDGGDGSAIAASSVPTYRFLHDRVQQAAYTLIPESQKQATHLQIGQLLLSHIPESEREEKVFDIVNQLNYGVDLIADEGDRLQLAKLNAIAGQKAKTATAYASAKTYLEMGRFLLPKEAWQNHYSLTLDLYVLGAETAYLSADFEAMDRLAQTVLDRSVTLLDRVKIYEIKLSACTSQVQPQKAVAMGVEVLDLLGIHFPSEPTPNDIESALGETASLFVGKNIVDLADASEMRDQEKQAALRILSAIISPCYITAPLLLPLAIVQMVRLSFEYGNAPLSAFAYGLYGLVLSGVIGDIETGYEFGKLALKIVDRFNANYLKTKVFYTVGVHIIHGKKHVRETLPLLKEGYRVGLETGELELGYSGKEISQYSYLTGKNLNDLEGEVSTYCQTIAQYKQGAALNYTRIVHQVLLNLLGRSPDPCRLIGDAYDEEQMLPFHLEANDRNGLHYLYFHKMLVCYYFGDDLSAQKNAVEAEKYLDAVTGMLNVPTFYCYDSLARLAVCQGDRRLDAEHLDRVAKNQEILQKWADRAPMNFSHKFELVRAERLRAMGQFLQAMEAYDRAIIKATENGYLNEQALANERAAKFYLEWGKEKIASVYFVDAYYAYARWGAKAKIEQLEHHYSQWLTSIVQSDRIILQRSETLSNSSEGELPTVGSIFSTNQTISRGTTSAEMIDLPTIIKASQAISSEIEIDCLLSSLLRVAIQNAGAQTGALFLQEQKQWMLAVYCEKGADCLFELTPLEDCQNIPLTIINYVRRKSETLVFDDASNQVRFAADPYIIQVQPKSILCTPIRDRGKIKGIVYLENNITTGVFTRDRVTLLNVLCSQAAISIDNARLYRKSQEYAQKLEKSLHDLEEMQLQLIQSEKMSALGNLVAGVAHEINNPVGFLAGNLQPARGYIQDLFDLLDLYRHRYPNPGEDIADKIEEIDLEFLREDLPESIASMKEGIDRIRNISTSLRTFSRADKARPAAFDIHDGIDSTLLILKHRLKANKARPEISVVKNYGKFPEIKCFPGQLNQVFMNILANAIDALEEFNSGRSKSELKKHPNQIEITTAFNEQKQQVSIRFKDNGPGMSLEVKSKIFDRLFTTKPVGLGTGLGLSIARQIVVEKHGGAILVNSTLGEGTEFVIELPVTAPDPDRDFSGSKD